MIKRLITGYKFSFLTIIFILGGLQGYCLKRYSVATGNWNSTSTWSATSGGASGASVPIAADSAFIEGTRTVTVTVNASCTNVSIATGATLTVGGFNFTVSGQTTVNGAITFTNTAGTKTMGSVTIAGGIWTSNAGETYGITALTLSGSTINGSATGILNVGSNLSVTAGTTNTLNATTITVTGTSTIDGNLTFSSTSGTKIFNGLTTVTANGNWNNTINEAITFRGGLTNNGVFSAGTSTYTFDTNNQTITGTLSIPNITITGITLTNNGSLTIGTALAGTGGLTQGLATSALNLGGTSGITTLTAAVNGNLVNFSGAAQTVNPTSYSNLTLSGSGTKTTAGITVNVVLSMEGTATLSAVPTYGTAATLQYNTATSRTAAAEWISPFTSTGGIIIANTGTITMNSAEILGASVPLTINSGATLASANFQLTLGGNFNKSGTFTAGSSNIIITGTSATQSIGSFTTTGTVSITKTSGTATFNGTINGGTLSIGTGSTPLNLGTGLTHSFGNLTLGGNGQPAGSWGGTGSSATFINPTYFAASTGIANISTSSCTAGYWIGATNTDWNTSSNWCGGTVPTAATNVVIPSGGTQPVISAASVCNNLTINSGATLVINGSNTLTVSGNWTNNGTFTAGTGTVVFNGSAQTVGTGPFNNLTLGGSGVKTITGVTVNGILSMEGTASASAAPTYGSNATLQYNKTGAFTAGPEWVANFSAAGGIIITNTGTITMNSAEVLNALLTINSGASLSMSTFLLTLNSNLINNGGTVSGTTGGVTISVTATQSIGSFTTTGTVSMTKTAGTATLTGNINGTGLTINGSGGTLTLDNGTALTHTFTGAWTQTAGTVNCNLSTLSVSTITNTGGTFNSNTGTVVFTGSTTIPNLNYYNLYFTGTTTKTVGAGVTILIASNWNVSSPATLTTTAGATVTGSISGTGAITMGSGTLSLGGDFTNTGTFTCGTGTVNYNGVTQMVMGNTYYDLTISNSGIKTTTSATITVNHNLAIAGSATFNLTYGVIGNTTGTFSMAAGTSLIIGTTGSGNMLFPTNFTAANISLNSSSTVTYNSDTAVQTVSNTPTYGNLIISNSNSKSVLLTATPLVINGTLQVNAGNTFALGAATSGYALNINGNAIINGTFDFGGGGISKILNLTGNLSGSGSITQTTNIGHTLNLGGANNSIGSFVTFAGSGSTVNYNGSGSQQVFASPNYINLTLSGGGAKALQGATSVSNILTLTSGILTTTSTNLLSLTNTSTTAIAGGSATSFINGPVSWTLPSALTSGSTYTFPVGMGTTYLPFALVNPTTTGTATAQVSAFAANPGGTFDATLVSISTTEYWTLTTSGSFTNSNVSLTRPSSIAPLDAIGGSVSLTGPYTSLLGTTGTNGVTNSNPIGTNTFFVLAGRKLALNTGIIPGSPFCAGAAVSVPYTISGTYTSGNIFTAQLSDASGSFTSPVAIGTLTQTTAGTIAGTIPPGTLPGTAYRIRVVSTAPTLTGTDNGTNLTVSPGTAISSQSTSAQTQCINSSFTAISVIATGAGTLSYQWFSNSSATTTGGISLGSANGAQTNSYTPQATSAGTLYYYCVVSGTCGSATSSVSGAFLVNPLPTITTTLPGSQCGNGTVTLGATASGTINWYAASTGGTSLGTGSTFTTPVLTSTTTYYVDVTSNGCISAARTAVVATIIPNATLTIGGGGTFCSGTNITLTSTGTNVSNQYWVGPNNFYSVLTNPVLSNSTSAMSGTYKLWASGVSGFNLVYNGNFEAGNVGFTSGYGYVAPSSNALYPEGLYTVVANPNTVHPNFIACGDHTTGSGLQMIVNGAVTVGVNIWSQTVNVAPNNYYQFTYWIQSVTGSNPAQLQLFVNGVAAGPIYTADLTTCSWEQFLYNWNSGSSTTAVLSLVNMNTIAGGNDFALDDIIFQQVCPASSTRSVGGGSGSGGGGSSSGVAYTDSVVVTVNQVVAAGTITGPNPSSICSGSTPGTITSSGPGTGSGTISYEWQTNASGSYVTISGATTAAYSPPALTATTSYQRRTVSVSGGTTCYSPYTTAVTITVSGPIANAGGPDALCQSASPSAFPLAGAIVSGGATSGTWSILSGGGTLSLTTQTANPANVTYTPAANYSGTVTLKLTTNTVGGCAGIATRTITINPAATAAAGSAFSICSNTGAVNITTGSTATNYSVVTWSSSGTGTFSNVNSLTAATYTPSATDITAGSVTLTLTATGNSPCGNVTSTKILTITKLPVATFSYAGTPYCSNSANPSPTFSGGGVAGTFSSTTGLNFVSTSTGQVNLGTSTPGTYVVTNTIAAAGGCGVVTATSSITITAWQTATISYAGTPFCKNLVSAQPVTFTGTLGGVFSSTTGLTIDAGTGAVTPGSSNAGTYTVTYTIAAANGCSTVTATASITITAVPTATINYASASFCSSLGTAQTVTLSGTGAYTGGTYSSTTGLSINSTTGAITPGSSTAGTYIVTYSLPASGGCASIPATTTVTITALPVATFSYSGSPYCSNASNPTPTFSGGGIAGTFSSTSGLNFISTSTGQVNLATSTPGTYTVVNTIAAAGGCGVVAASGSLVVNPASVGGTISGAVAEVCQGGATGTMTLSGYAGAIQRWERQVNSLGWASVGFGGATTYSETPYSGGTWQYRAAIQNGSCPLVYSSPATILVDSTTTVGYLYNGATPICQGASFGVLSLGPSTGRVVQWEKRLNSGTWTVISNTTRTYTEIPSSSGTWDYRVMVQSGICNFLYSNTVTVVVTPTLSITLGPNPVICKTTTVALLSYTATTGSPTAYSITFDAAAIAAGMSNVTGWGLAASPININVSYYIAAGVYNGLLSVSTTNPICSSITYPITLTVQDNLLPLSVTGNSAPCQGSSQIYTATSLPGAIYNWVFPSGWTQTSGGTTNTATVTVGSNSGNVQVTPNFTCGSGTAQTLAVSPALLATASISYAGAPYCNSLATPQNVTFSGTTGGTYTASPSGLTINASTGAITPSTSTAGTYTVTYSVASSGGCGAVTATVPVTITTLPVGTFSYAGSPYCSNGANPLPTFSGGGVAGTFSSSAGLNFVSTSTGQINLATSTPGTYTVTNTIAAIGGCSVVTSTSSVTINPILAASIAISPSANPACSSTSVTFTATPTNGGTSPSYQWKVNGINAGTNNSSYSYSPTTGDVVTCLLTSNSTCATGNPATSNAVTMTVNPNLPVSLSITPSANPVCPSATVNFTATPSNGGASPSYQWKVNGTNAGTNSATYSYAPTNNDAITCVLTSNATCATGSPSTSNTVTMTVNPNLPVSVSIAASVNPVCAGTVVSYTATPTNGGSAPSYQWKVNGTNAGTNSATYSYAPANNDIITCVLTSNATCTTGNPATSNIVTMTVTPVPTTATVSTTPLSYCSTLISGSLGANTPTIGSGAWSVFSGGTGTFSAPTSGSSTFTANGYGTYVLAWTISNETCTASTAYVTVNYYPSLTAGISGGSSPICYNTAPGTFTATGSGGNGTYTYQWYTTTGIINGATSSAYAPGNITGTTGYYCAVTSGICGSVNTATTTITVNGNLTAGISGGSSPICYNTAPGTFTATGSGGNGTFTYQWYSTSGIITGATSSTYTPGNLTTTTGYYCAVTSSSCGTVNTSTTTITVYGNLTANISGGSTPLCYNSAPGTFTATGSGGNGTYTYLWYKNGTSTGVTTQTYAPGNLTATSTFYCAITSGSCGTLNTSNTTITVYGNLTASISGGSTPICYNTAPGTFTASGSGGNGTYTYQWYTTTGIINGATNSTYAPGNITATTGYYCAVTSGSCGTVNTSVTTITVNGTLTAGISGGSSPICYNTSPGTFTATGTGGTGTYTYLWYKNGTTTGITTQTYNPGNLATSSTFYCAITSGSCGTVNTSTTAITVSGNLTVGIGGGTSPICYNTAPGTFTATGSGGSGTYTYQWYTTSGIIAGATNPTYTPGSLTTTTGYYCAVTSGSCGTVNTSTTTITVYGNLTAGISGGTSPICYNTAPGTFTATGSGGTGIYTYQWYSTSGIITGATSSTYTPPAITTTTGYYCAVTSGSCGTVNTSTSTITVYNNLSAGISGGSSPICYNSAPGTFTATGSGGNGSYTYQWYSTTGIITGATGSTYTPSSITTTTGYYCAVTSGSCGTINTSTTTITVYANLSALISGGSSPICYNSAPGTFTATGIGGTGSYTYLWYMNGTSTGITTPTYAPGNLTSTSSFYCAITSGSCGTVNTSTTTITVYGNLTANISGGSSPICYNSAPGTFTATGGGGNGAYTYQWYTTTGIINGATSSTYAPGNITSSAGYYCAITSASCGTVNTSTTSITVYGNLTATISGGSSPICYNSAPGTFTATGSGGNGSYTYQWYSSTGIITGATTSTYTPASLTASGGYYCAVTSGSCGTVNTSTTTITVYSNLGAGISGGSTPICYNNAPGTFSATGNGGTGSYTYLWYMNGVSTGITTQTYTPGNLNATSTFYCAITSGSCGTVNTATTTINVYGNLTATISGGSSPICYNTAPGTFTATGGGGTGSYTYLWYLNGSSTGITTQTFTPGNLTSSAAFYCAITSGSCGTVNTATTTITVFGNLTANISGGSSPICYNSLPGTFTVTAGGGNGTYTYQWYTTSGIIGGATGSTYTPGNITTTTGYYCSVTSSSCTTVNTSTITITVYGNLTAGISGGSTPICYNTSPGFLTTTGSGGNGSYTYQWYSTTGIISGAINSTYSPGNLTTTTGYYCAVTSGSCGTVNTSIITITVYADLTANISGGTSPICYNTAPGTITATGGGGSGSYTYLWYKNDVSTGVITQTYTPGNLTSTSTISCAITSASCTTVNSSSITIIVTPLPTASIIYPGTPFCTSINTSQAVTLSGTAAYTGGNFSTNSGLTIDVSTGAILPSTSSAGSYTVTYTVPASGGCGIVTTTTPVIINLDGSWTGSINTDWSTPGNWTCNQIPTLTSDVVIASGLPHYPATASSSPALCRNLSIQNGASVIVNGYTLQIAGTISNSGTFTASAGTIEMKGSAAQTIGANTFTGNTIQNLTISNSSGVTLAGTLNVSGIVNAASGNLTSGGNLTLISSPSQTALVDGTGTGNIFGNVTMQRYLPTAFGYKYFSSPFQAATVSGFGSYMDLTASFPTFYKYDENNSRDSLGHVAYQSGWVKYTTGTNLLVPPNGYAVNFGTSGTPETVNLNGIVNNGVITISLINHNRKYTKGFNLVGNPYPSPIDWNDSSGWTKTNIDDAIYFFNPGNTDQYTGVYSSYINRISTGNGDNQIASMQGFFVHVSDGSYPVSGTLAMNNGVRTNNLNPLFREAIIDTRTVLRFTTRLETNNAIEDVMVLYFDENSGMKFDKTVDALKMMNTDLLVPNIYILSADSREISIKSLPTPKDSITRIPLGINTLSDGWINFNAKDITQLPSNLQIYLADGETGITQDLRKMAEYRFFLKTGSYNQRFTLVFSLSELKPTTAVVEKLFTFTPSASLLMVTMNLPFNAKGELFITNMNGQIIMRKEVTDQETVEINPASSSGLYILTVISGNRRTSEKILMRKNYE